MEACYNFSEQILDALVAGRCGLCCRLACRDFLSESYLKLVLLRPGYLDSLKIDFHLKQCVYILYYQICISHSTTEPETQPDPV